MWMALTARTLVVVCACVYIGSFARFFLCLYVPALVRAGAFACMCVCEGEAVLVENRLCLSRVCALPSLQMHADSAWQIVSCERVEKLPP